MKVLMFGWEFPPLSSGGLGTACYGLTKGLSNKDVEVTFVMPSNSEIQCDFARIIPTGIVKFRKIDSIITPYMTSDGYSLEIRKRPQNLMYGSDIFKEVYRYSKIAAKIAEEEDFDIIHCHDWMTFGAGIEAKKVSGKPLVVHVHATEFDRTGGTGANEYVYSMEKEGMNSADKIITVSNYTKSKIVYHYGINPNKVEVVHNAIEVDNSQFDNKAFRINTDDKVVLFLGRITLQKGPDYFLYAAKQVLNYEKNVKFIIAGTGDMERYLIEKSAEMGISDKILFTGFLKGNDIDKAFRMADLYVMPSVSEPFGISTLEAMKNNTPVIISKQSGVSEVINSCLKVDFWDVNELANKMIGVLRYNALGQTLRENGSNEIKKFTWDIPAQKCIDIYQGLINQQASAY